MLDDDTGTTITAIRIEFLVTPLATIVTSTFTVPVKFAGAAPTTVVLSALRATHGEYGSVAMITCTSEVVVLARNGARSISMGACSGTTT